MAERDWYFKDYYEILGVSRYASREEIVQAYRQLSQGFDPGAGGDPGGIIFKDVSEAHAVLSDDELRAEYDVVRAMVAAGLPPPPVEEPADEEPAPEAAPRRPKLGVGGLGASNWNAAVVAVVVGCSLFLMFGYLFKASCIDNFPKDAYRITCYNDLQPLYGERLFDERGERVFPYIHARSVDEDGNGGADLTSGSRGAIEYPVLTGVFMWFTGLFSGDSSSFLRWSALFLAPFGLITAYLLARMTGWRALLWSLAPAIVLYSFHNWDLLVVAAAVFGIYLWWKGEPIWAAVLFGIGGAFKAFPIFFLAPLALDLWIKGDKRRTVRSAIAGGGTALAINLPFMLANFEGWVITYTFHQDRGPNYDTLWCTMRDNCLSTPFWEPSDLNKLTALLTGAFFLAALGFGWIRARKEGRYPFLPVCGALLCSFLLWNKVHSPQYALWILPFFVLIRVHVLWWVAYAIGDLMVYIGVFRWFYSFAVEQDFPALRLMEAGIWTRAALLLALFVVFLRSSAAHETTSDKRVALKEWLSQPLRRTPSEQT